MEGPGRGEFTKLVANHVLVHLHRQKLPAVINAKGQADELRQDGRTARPDLDDLVAAGGPGGFRLAQQIPVDERAFPYRTRHRSVLPAFRAADDEIIRTFVITCLVTLGRLTPRRDRMTASGGTAFTTTMRVVDRVHRRTAVMRLAAHPTAATGLADLLVLVVGVRHRADRRHAFGAHHAQLAGHQLDLRIATVLADQLREGAGRTGHLAAGADLELDIMDDRAHGNGRKRHRIARLDVHARTGDDLIADLQALRRQNVGQLAIGIFDQRDEGGAVRVIFQTLDRRGNIVLAALEVDQTVSLLVSTAAETAGDAAKIVAATGRGLTFGQALH